MNIKEKLYNKIYLNAVLASKFIFCYIVYFGVVTSHKILKSCRSTSSLAFAKDSFLKRSC